MLQGSSSWRARYERIAIDVRHRSSSPPMEGGSRVYFSEPEMLLNPRVADPKGKHKLPAVIITYEETMDGIPVSNWMAPLGADDEDFLCAPEHECGLTEEEEEQIAIDQEEWEREEQERERLRRKNRRQTLHQHQQHQQQHHSQQHHSQQASQQSLPERSTPSVPKRKQKRRGGTSPGSSSSVLLAKENVPTADPPLPIPHPFPQSVPSSIRTTFCNNNNTNTSSNNNNNTNTSSNNNNNNTNNSSSNNNNTPSSSCEFERSNNSNVPPVTGSNAPPFLTGAAFTKSTEKDTLSGKESPLPISHLSSGLNGSFSGSLSTLRNGSYNIPQTVEELGAVRHEKLADGPAGASHSHSPVVSDPPPMMMKRLVFRQKEKEKEQKEKLEQQQRQASGSSCSSSEHLHISKPIHREIVRASSPVYMTSLSPVHAGYGSPAVGSTASCQPPVLAPPPSVMMRERAAVIPTREALIASVLITLSITFVEEDHRIELHRAAIAERKKQLCVRTSLTAALIVAAAGNQTAEHIRLIDFRSESISGLMSLVGSVGAAITHKKMYLRRKREWDMSRILRRREIETGETEDRIRISLEENEFFHGIKESQSEEEGTLPQAPLQVEPFPYTPSLFKAADGFSLLFGNLAPKSPSRFVTNDKLSSMMMNKVICDDDSSFDSSSILTEDENENSSTCGDMTRSIDDDSCDTGEQNQISSPIPKTILSPAVVVPKSLNCSPTPIKTIDDNNNIVIDTSVRAFESVTPPRFGEQQEPEPSFKVNEIEERIAEIEFLRAASPIPAMMTSIEVVEEEKDSEISLSQGLVVDEPVFSEADEETYADNSSTSTPVMQYDSKPAIPSLKLPTPRKNDSSINAVSARTFIPETSRRHVKNVPQKGCGCTGGDGCVVM